MRERFYSTAPNSEPARAVLAAIQYGQPQPNWDLLEHAVEQAGLPLDVCGEFMWMGELPAGTHSYKHRDTRKYVRLTKSTCAPQLLVREARV